MFSENLKTLRKAKGLTQEELAIRLNIVRQTVSKWEKGSSVPDADMLIKISEILETAVSELLGAKIEDKANQDDIAEQLARVNEQLAIKNYRSKAIFKVVVGLIIGILAINILLTISGVISFNKFGQEGASMTQSEIVVSTD